MRVCCVQNFEPLRKVCDVLFLMYCEGVVICAWVECGGVRRSSSFGETSWVIAMVLTKGILALLRLSAVKELSDHDSNLTSRPIISWL